MFNINNDLLTFEKIEKIEFIKVSDDGIFEIRIHSDIQSDEYELNNTLFIAQHCKLDSNMVLKLHEEPRITFNTPNGYASSKTLTIPMNVQLLTDDVKSFFTIHKKEQ